MIPGVHYAPEVTLNILSINLLEKQGFEITYENNRCSLVYMFNNTKNYKIDEDIIRTMQNQYLEDYFESLAKKDARNEEDLIQIKGRTYSTKVSTFNEYVAFLNLIKQDEVVSQEWDRFRKKFDKVVKWFYKYYLDRSLPGSIPPTINGLSKQDGEEMKRCYINYLDVFTSYYKTARVPQQEYNCILNNPTKKVEENIERICPISHQWDFDETCAPSKTTTNQKGKGKLEHFGVKLEDTEDGEDKNKWSSPSTSAYGLPNRGKEDMQTLSITLVSKLALNAYSQVLARRYEGVASVNCFCPGFTQTSMTDGKGNHSANDDAEMAATIAFFPPETLTTGKFYTGVLTTWAEPYKGYNMGSKNMDYTDKPPQLERE
nr:bulb-type lectin domain-containing protein [Tanacetum cinerariifolium]